MSLKDTLRQKLTPELFTQVTDALGDDFNFDVVPRSRLNKVIGQRDTLKEQLEAAMKGTQTSRSGGNSDDDDDDDDFQMPDLSKGKGKGKTTGLTQEEVARQIEEATKNARTEMTIQFAGLDALRNANAVVSMLERGVIYLHAKMPTIIKEYLEDVFKKESTIKYMIANNVILEGVNHPIDNLFIASTYSIQGKQLINLIGRVNRLNEVFSGANSSLDRLISTVHFIEHSDYSSSDMKNKIVLLRDYSFSDEIENPLIESYNVNKRKTESKEAKDKEIIDTTDIILSNKAETLYDRIVKYLLENDIVSMYTSQSNVYHIIENNIKSFVWYEGIQIVDVVYEIFVKNLEPYICDIEISRLQNKPAINYYNRYLTNIQKMSLNEKIVITTNYFKEKAVTHDPLLYIGASYGECSKTTNDYQAGKMVYVNLVGKSEREMVNLAIVKLKIEEDFISYKLVKLIQFLHDFEIIPNDFYNQYMYGTVDETVISLVRQGLGVNVVKKIFDDNQIANLYWDNNGNLKATEDFILYMKKLSPLVRFELEKHLI